MEWIKKEGFQGFVDVFFGRPMFTFHEVFTGQGNSKLLPVRTFDVDVLKITFLLFEDTKSNDCAITPETFAGNAP